MVVASAEHATLQKLFPIKIAVINFEGWLQLTVQPFQFVQVYLFHTDL